MEQEMFSADAVNDPAYWRGVRRDLVKAHLARIRELMISVKCEIEDIEELLRIDAESEEK